MEPDRKRHSPSCYECGGNTEIIEADLEKGAKVMRCKQCGTKHFYKKDFLERWRLHKVWKETDLTNK